MFADRTRSLTKSLAYPLASVLALGSVGGCGHSASDLIPLALEHAPPSVRETYATKGSVPVDPSMVTIDYPFPERENPFLFPSETVVIQPVTAKMTDIRVLGFVKVDRPRVLLQVKNVSRTLAVGETTQGIEVVSIDPPSVKLRQGNLTWNASLFD
ncbi:hypothetical protein FF011L_00520 [Roseimaritima multifibrata]|uniref:Uncharacterized protein n=1 Tax=Roseimaritima multifibrata TaxID=1930274 RepID=A0A517M8W1_9BACT|nr:hypothetical protein [Roseimaritima multifibrata]QDS91323.1 hypothetical protein FF011L_00520 [Roseimaritima multifibrata]